ncbi:MAG TPA: FtsK/SpoIIIE domain-containing protein, partial [Mycobacteriales bacterium]|nr:FtsK/SpoIIIE domain-containing protein [Mycobacteriales bacterium]
YRVGPNGQPIISYPRLRSPRAHRYGFYIWLSLLPGQTPGDVEDMYSELAHAWQVHGVQMVDVEPGHLRLSITVRDPLTSVVAPPPETELLKAAVGMLETAEPWVIDFRSIPHWLVVGATQSGKSTLINALIVALSRQRVALIGIDLKAGVELGPYLPRLSKLATSRAESVEVLEGLVAILLHRMTQCSLLGVRNIWELPETGRPTPIVTIIDEVAELYLVATDEDKEHVNAVTTYLLRIAQLGRAAGIHLIVAGQRFGSDVGRGATALRAQLGGRICHRVNDPETSRMVLGDLTPEGAAAATKIKTSMRGVAVVVTDDGLWHRARSVYTSAEEAEKAAHDNAHLAVPWQALQQLTDSLGDEPAATDGGEKP